MDPPLEPTIPYNTSLPTSDPLFEMSMKWDNETSTSATDLSTTSQNDTKLPLDMQFNDGHLLSVIVYSFLMVVSAIGNLFVLSSMIKLRMKARLNRVNLLLLHLAIADLLVTFLMMPMEIGWNSTVSWKGGDVMCRLLSFFRTFGLYLSGFIVVCISFDRYFAVLRPLALPEANKRSRLMIWVSWVGASVCSVPQAIIFHVERHPTFIWYEQCITLNSFSSKEQELVYNFFGFTFMYAFPMVVILFCYISILYEIYKVNALKKNGEGLRRSSSEALTRAKVRTLKMTLVIVITFFLCWTPYNVMSLWYWIDKESAQAVDQRIQKCLFLFACTNSCVNPLIYGIFHIRNHRQRKKELRARQALIAQSCRMERMERPPYGVRVRWNRRGCICPGTSGSSSDNNRPPGQMPLVDRNQPNKHQRQNTTTQSRRGTRSTADNLYGSQRRTKSTNLIPLTSREFQRHIPPAEIGTSSSTKNGVVAVMNNNSLHANSSKTPLAPGISDTAYCTQHTGKLCFDPDSVRFRVADAGSGEDSAEREQVLAGDSEMKEEEQDLDNGIQFDAALEEVRSE